MIRVVRKWLRGKWMEVRGYEVVLEKPWALYTLPVVDGEGSTEHITVRLGTPQWRKRRHA